MGMRATYRYLSDKNLKELKYFYEIEDNISEEVEDSNEEMGACGILRHGGVPDLLFRILESRLYVLQKPICNRSKGLIPIPGKVKRSFESGRQRPENESVAA